MVRTEFDDQIELAEVYTVYNTTSTNAAIIDAKDRYADKHLVDRDKLTARKFGSGWDSDRNEMWMRIVVSLSYETVK